MAIEEKQFIFIYTQMFCVLKFYAYEGRNKKIKEKKTNFNV